MSFRNRVYHLHESVSFTRKRPRRPETGIKHGFKEMEHEVLLGYSIRKIRTIFSDVPLLLEIFRWNDEKLKVMFRLLSNRIFRNLFVNGKQPSFRGETSDGVFKRSAVYYLRLQFLPRDYAGTSPPISYGSRPRDWPQV